jgi:hypothetical protein
VSVHGNFKFVRPVVDTKINIFGVLTVVMRDKHVYIWSGYSQPLEGADSYNIVRPSRTSALTKELVTGTTSVILGKCKRLLLAIIENS